MIPQNHPLDSLKTRIIRQHRETDYAGHFIAKRASKPAPRGTVRTMKSAFDDSEQYELTALGQQFVHYAMTELTVKIAYAGTGERKDTNENNGESGGAAAEA